MPHVNVGACKIYYERSGTGPALVFIPGLSGDISEVTPLLEPLQETLTVVVLDNRGAGRSDSPKERYTIEGMAADVDAVMHDAKIDNAIVVGVSMGGRIALALTLDFPRRVNHLVLVSTGARVVPSLFRSLLFATLPRLPIGKGRYPQSYDAFCRQRQASQGYDATPRLGEIQVPTLILHGPRDKVARPSLAIEMHEEIAGSTLDWCDGGHLFFMKGGREHFLQAVWALASQS